VTSNLTFWWVKGNNKESPPFICIFQIQTKSDLLMRSNAHTIVTHIHQHQDKNHSFINVEVFQVIGQNPKMWNMNRSKVIAFSNKNTPKRYTELSISGRLQSTRPPCCTAPP
jgi:hypothetical protein